MYPLYSLVHLFVVTDFGGSHRTQWKTILHNTRLLWCRIPSCRHLSQLSSLSVTVAACAVKNSSSRPNPPEHRAHSIVPSDGLIYLFRLVYGHHYYLYILQYNNNTRAHVRARNNNNNNNNIMPGIICRKLLVKKPVKRIRCARVSIDRLFSGRAHQNHNIIYNPSIFARRNICTAVPLINILS